MDQRRSFGRASARSSQQQRHNSNNYNSNKLGGSSLHTTASSYTAAAKERNVLDHLPPEFLANAAKAPPSLHYLPRLLSEQSDVTLSALLKAAEDDVRLHRARIKAGLAQDTRLVRTYQRETDPNVIARRQRIEARKNGIEALQYEQTNILLQLQETAESTTGLTQAERTRLHINRWQRALALYVHQQQQQQSSILPHESNNKNKNNNNNSIIVTWQILVEQLLNAVAEDQDVSEILKEAADMCRDVLTQTQQAVQDNAEHVTDYQINYLIRLEAHQQFASQSLRQVTGIGDQFHTSGKAALLIGHQLEHAELKRSQCEAASVLIRRWWNLEQIAEQERNKGSNHLALEEEIHGNVPANACKMDPIYTKPENSLEAAKTLQQLRAVVRAKSNASADATSTRRFEITAALIQRTSEALERRLLNTFAKVYTTGGTYDFSPKPRPGSIDWRELRALAQALLLFDSGRNLHQRYVDMVVATRLPEFFKVKSNDNDDDDDDDDEVFDMDATRTKLAALFHHVGEVCTAEFELIAFMFGMEGNRADLLEGNEEMPLVVARALLQRVISDPEHGLQAKINDLLSSMDRKGDFESGAKKLDTFVVIHEKAAGLFGLLREAAERMAPESSVIEGLRSQAAISARSAVESLKGFLTSQELALSNQHRQGYVNVELRCLHHNCCSSLDQVGCTLVKGPPPRPDRGLAEKGILEEYKAPVLPLHKPSLMESGFTGILAGPLKQSVLRQPLIHATDSIGRARLMFGASKRGGETTARVIFSIYHQMCAFYGVGFLYPVVESIREMLPNNAPSSVPQLPFDEEQDAPDLGVSPAFWVALERVHSAAKSFDRELWAENRIGSLRVWELLEQCGDYARLEAARAERTHFYNELERRGEAAILKALDTLSTHVQWVLVIGGESMTATGGKSLFNTLTGQSGGPYAIPAGSSLDTPNSPAVKSLTYSLRVQFVHVQAALTPSSLASFWTALSMRLYDILVARLLQFYYISTVGAVILSRDVEALRSVAMLAGTDHSHWDTLRELLTLYMTPPDAIKAMLTGPEGEPGKGLFIKAGRDQALVFLSRRIDYRFKTTTGMKKSQWVVDLLNDLNVMDPTDGPINIALFAAGRKHL